MVFKYSKSKQVSSISKARKIIYNLNKNNKNHNHILVDDYVTFFIILKTFFQYFLFNFFSFRFKIIFSNDDLNNNLLLFKKNFKDSLSGKNIFNIILNYNVYKDILSQINSNSKIIYIMENQFWEKLLNFFAKENGIKTYGFPHAGIRFFDLRYFLYPEIFNNNNNYLPFRFIEHSLDTKNAFSYLNFKKKNIVKLESLRFMKYIFNKI